MFKIESELVILRVKDDANKDVNIEYCGLYRGNSDSIPNDSQSLRLKLFNDSQVDICDSSYEDRFGFNSSTIFYKTDYQINCTMQSIVDTLLGEQVPFALFGSNGPIVKKCRNFNIKAMIKRIKIFKVWDLNSTMYSIPLVFLPKVFSDPLYVIKLFMRRFLRRKAYIVFKYKDFIRSTSKPVMKISVQNVPFDISIPVALGITVIIVILGALWNRYEFTKE